MVAGKGGGGGMSYPVTVSIVFQMMIEMGQSGRGSKDRLVLFQLSF